MGLRSAILLIFGFVHVATWTLGSPSPLLPETQRLLGLDETLELPPTERPFALETQRSAVTFLKMRITAQGLYALTGRALLDAGWPADSLRGNQVRIAHRGREVATLASTEGAMSADDRIWFYAEGVQTAHTDERIYWIGPGDATRMVADTPRRGGLLRDSYRAEVAVQAPTLFAGQFLPAFDFDHWFAGKADLPAPFVVSLGLEDAMPDHTVSLSLRAAAGTSRWWQNEARPLVVSINGERLGEMFYQGEGRTPSRLTAPFSSFQIGANELRFEVQQADVAYIRDLTLQYQRKLRPLASGTLCFSSDRYRGEWQLEGFDPLRDWYLDVTDRDQPLRLSANADGSLNLETDRVIFACKTRAIRTPELEPAVVSAHILAQDARPEYVIITDTRRLPNATQLAAYRARQGLDVALLDIHDIYDHFSYGYEDPSAIRRCLGWLWQGGAGRLRFAVLVGDGAHVRPNATQEKEHNIVPVVMGAGAFERTAHDQMYASFVGDDMLPDIALGRIPVQTPAQLSQFLAKLTAFESAGVDAEAMTRSLFIADRRDTAGDFKGLCETLRAGSFSGLQSETAYLDDHSLAVIQNRVRDSLSAGEHGWLVYNGHGYASTWANNILTADDAETLTNTSYPIVTALACSTGGFHNDITSISEALLCQRHGAIAVIAATSLTSQFNSRKLSEGMFQAIHEERVATLGEAVLHGRRNLAHFAPGAQALQFYHLIGDPALQIHHREENIEVAITRSPRGLNLSWNSRPGAVYRLSQCGNLEEGRFEAQAAELVATGDSLSIPMPDTPHGGCAFRVDRIR